MGNRELRWEHLVINTKTLKKTVCVMPSKSFESWENETFARLQSLNSYFAILKLGGNCDYPCHVFRGNSSKSFKRYALALCITSVVFTIQSLVFFINPDIVPESYILLKSKHRHIARYAIPLWSLATSTLRIAMVNVLFNEGFPKHIRAVLWDIANDPHLKHHVLFTSNLPKYLGVPFFLFGFFFVIAWYVGFVTFKHVLPLLKVTNQRFLRAAETMNIDALREAIACHDKCWNLIECIDRIAGYFMGICLSLAIPTTVLTVGFLTSVTRELASFYPVLVWTIYFFSSMGFLIHVTGSIHTTAHLPDAILTKNLYSCLVFRDYAFQFRARFTNQSIGYTYFGYATFRKETFLTILNIVATYVVVGFQLRSNEQTSLSNLTSTIHE